MTSIGEYAFVQSSLSGRLELPASLTSLGAYAFAQNEGITSVTVPAGVAGIGEAAFAKCTALTSVTLAAGVGAIGDYAFMGDAVLTDVTLPASLGAIGKGAFAACTALRTVALPAGLAEIADYTFYGATSLDALTLPEAVTSIGNFAFFGAEKLAGLDFTSVTSVGKYAFVGTALTALDAGTVETVGDYAFAKTHLTSVRLPAATDIGAYAFAETKELISLSLDRAVHIGEGAFARATGLTSVSLPACETLGDLAFAFAGSLTSLDVPALQTIGSYAIYNTKVSSVTLPASLTYVAPNALTTKAYNSTDDSLVRLTGITLDSANRNFFLDNGVLYQKLSDGSYLLVAYPSGKTDKTYAILDKTVRIEAYAFANNPYLEDVTVARTVKSIGDGAFYGSTSLHTLRFLSVTAPTLESHYSAAAVNGWSYSNFVYDFADADKAPNLHITVPKNAAGYDSLLWKGYIGTVENTDVISMTDGTAALNESIRNLPAAITLADAETVDRLERMYNATSADQRIFVENYAKLQSAIATVQRLRAEQGDDSPEPPTPDTPQDSKSGLPAYAIVLIVVGAVVVLAGAGAAVWFLVIRKRTAPAQDTGASDTTVANTAGDEASAGDATGSAGTAAEKTEETKGEDSDEN